LRIGKKINLSLEEKFNLFIKNRTENCYINDDGCLINVYSSSELINQELLKKGVDYKEKNINDILLEVEILKVKIVDKDFKNLNKQDLKEENCEIFKTNQTVLKQLNVLKEFILELSFFLHDYQYEKMDLTLKMEFKNICQFADLLRKNKFTQ